METHYDQLYSETEAAFGGEKGAPEIFVTQLPKYFKEGKVLELGAGQGRNALWLARQGFQVEARDISSVGVDRIKKISGDEKLGIQVTRADAREQLQTSYSAILSTYMLHHLTNDEAREVISQMKNHTHPHGYNLVTVFTREGDFFKRDSTANKFYPNLGELREMYDDWETLEYEEAKTKARARKENGEPMFNISAKILARKPGLD